jgi:alpha-beta hydrolase superfamily lysophospholipase
MSADPQITGVLPQLSGVAEPLYLDAGGHTLFAWLHRPAADRAGSVGMVICKPFGYEAICSHRSLRSFAEASARVGVPTLRLDYLGTGDSADLDPEADQLQIWSQDIVAAVAELQRRTGVAKVCLFGVRLGALLAALAAEKCHAVSSMILIAPIISGRRYLRELRTTRMAAALATGAADGASEKTNSMEVSGFFFSQASLASLAKIDLNAWAAQRVSQMLVIDGSNFPASSSWAEKLATTGVQMTYRALPGMVEMVMTAPQFASVPLAMVEAVRGWLLQYQPASAARPETAGSSRERILAQQPLPIMRLPMSQSAQQNSITERPVSFGPEGQLFGILTLPRAGELRSRAVILLNAGADYHIGASGMSVGLARAWARSGYVVLRMDFAGIGDSGTRPGRPDNEIFPPEAVDDMRFAIDFVRTQHGVRDVTVAGLCSGAYHALRCAVAGLPADRVFMVNPQNYFWNEGMSIYGMQLAELVATPDAQSRRIFSWDRWRRVFTGQVDLRYIFRRYLQRILLRLESSWRDLARKMRIRLREDLGRDLEDIAARGVRMVFVFSRGEPGIELLRMQGGSSVKKLGDRCRVHVIDGADHVFSKLGPRLVLEKILSDELFARVERPDSVGSSSWSAVRRLP